MDGLRTGWPGPMLLLLWARLAVGAPSEALAGAPASDSTAPAPATTLNAAVIALVLTVLGALLLLIMLLTLTRISRRYLRRDVGQRVPTSTGESPWDLAGQRATPVSAESNDPSQDNTDAPPDDHPPNNPDRGTGRA